MEVPALNRKFRFLIRRGHFATLDEIAREFGVTKNTLQWWEHGDDSRPPNHLPDKHVGRLVAIISRCHPDRLSSSMAMTLIAGPYDAFVQAFEALDAPVLTDLIAREASRDGIELVLKSGLELFEIDNADAGKPDFSVPANVWFRLIVRERLENGFVAGLRLQDGGSYSVPATEKDDRILLPGLKRNGMPAHMRETDAPARIEFVVMQTMAPLPRALAAAARTSALLDSGLLGQLASLYNAMEPRQRSIHAARIAVTAKRSD